MIEKIVRTIGGAVIAIRNRVLKTFDDKMDAAQVKLEKTLGIDWKESNKKD